MMEGPLTPARSLLLAIRGVLPGLNLQERKVGQYVLDHPDEVIHLAMSKLAERCTVSDTTVFRFCRKVGTHGYQDLKIRLALESGAAKELMYATVNDEDSPDEAARKVIAADVKALEDTLKVLNFVALDKATAALTAARRVDIYGSGGAAVAALELQYKLLRIGVRALAYTDGEMQLISANLLAQDDLAIGISHSGESPDVLHALEAAKRAAASTIAITNHPASALARLADVSLLTAAQEALAHGYPLGARAAQIGLIDILYTYLRLRRQAETEQTQAHTAETPLRDAS
jgi:RpiR family carbohydrate utilization transcriptional regulator